MELGGSSVVAETGGTASALTVAAPSVPGVVPRALLWRGRSAVDTNYLIADPTTARTDLELAASLFDAAGDPVLAMIRGALPPRQFTDETEVVEIFERIPAVVGPIGDGFWAAAWAIPPGERCDLFSLIFYPPVESDEVIEVTASLR